VAQLIADGDLSTPGACSKSCAPTNEQRTEVDRRDTHDNDNDDDDDNDNDNDNDNSEYGCRSRVLLR
jgi:hypothetical protein